MNDIRQKLLATFQIEHRDHLERIRTLLAELGTGGDPMEAHLEEVFRRAHSLKGAARAVDLRPIETVAHRLETVFSRVREGTLRLDKPVLDVIQLVLNSMEDWMAALRENRPPEPLTRALEVVERLLGMGSAEPQLATDTPTPAIPFQPVETVRVSAGHLDRLLRSGGRLLTEILRQDLVTRELTQITHRLADLERGWERMSKASAAAFRHGTARPERSRVIRDLDSVGDQFRTLSRQVRMTHLNQQRSSWALRHLGDQLQQDVQRARMVPAESVFEGLRKMVRDIARDEGKEVEVQVSGLEVEADRVVLQALKDPLMHLLRNAVCHGIESLQDRTSRGKDRVGHVSLRMEARGNRFIMEVEDDGQGIDVKRVAEVAIKRGLLTEAEAAACSSEELTRLIFRPAFTTSRVVTELSGRGVGLSIVSEAVTRLQGEVDVRQRDGSGILIALSVPLSVSTHRLLLVTCQGQTFALPAHGIERLFRIKVQDVGTVEGRPVVTVNGQPVPLLSLSRLLNLSDPAVNVEGENLPVLLVRATEKRVAIGVDAFLAVRDGLIQDLGTSVARIGRLAAGGVLLEDGSVCLVLNPVELVEAVRESNGAPPLAVAKPQPREKFSTILVADDSITTRTLEKSLLEAHGYRVRVAVDGVEALAHLRSEMADLVVADIQMPRMDGFALLAAIKQDPRLSQIPVIIVTSIERREDVERGLALGADAYIVKRKFDQRELLNTIEQLL